MRILNRCNRTAATFLPPWSFAYLFHYIFHFIFNHSFSFYIDNCINFGWFFLLSVTTSSKLNCALQPFIHPLSSLHQHIQAWVIKVRKHPHCLHLARYLNKNILSCHVCSCACVCTFVTFTKSSNRNYHLSKPFSTRTGSQALTLRLWRLFIQVHYHPPH